MKSRKFDRVTEVDRSTGSVIFLRPKASANTGKLIYETPAKNILSSDKDRLAHVDAAYEYLDAKSRDHKDVLYDAVKAAFLGGVFIGMLSMYGLMSWLKLV